MENCDNSTNWLYSLHRWAAWLRPADVHVIFGVADKLSRAQIPKARHFTSLPCPALLRIVSLTASLQRTDVGCRVSPFGFTSFKRLALRRCTT
jgi:hypothetical protein